MTTKKDIIEFAEDMLGLTEQHDFAALSAFFLHYGGFRLDPREVPWCAAFVNSVLGEAEVHGTSSLAARSFLRWGKEITDPEMGDIVVLKRGNNTWQGHVGFFYGAREDAPGFIKILGGNQGDSVVVHFYDEKDVLGYRSAF